MTSVDIPWRKSSFSEANGECLEAASYGGGVLLRESDDADVVVRTSPQVLSVFLKQIKDWHMSSHSL